MHIKCKLAEKARAKAHKIHIIYRVSTNLVADRFGVNRSIIWR